ncbi:MAG: putative porin [Planctomycetes bacterium]|nr:putative porin [Planctomycetota bacterium]
MNSAMRVQLKRVCVCCVVLGMTTCVSGAYTNGDSDGDGTPWYENIDVSFDLTLRQEVENREYGVYDALGTRNSSQYEAHLNIHSQIADNVSANLQLATGYSNGSMMPLTSHYQRFEDKFSSKDVWFSQVYLNWQPSQVPGADVFAGKIPNIFERVGGNQVIWDEDVNPEGVGVNFLRSLDDSTNFHANGGVFAVEEAWGPGPASPPAGDVTLFAGQLAVDRQFNETACGLAGVSYYSYSNIVNQGGFANGNSQATGLANDFDLLELFAEYGSEINGMPCMLFGTWINNLGADTMGPGVGENGDTAWSIGGRINKAEAPGSWEVGYDYRDIEADSIVGIFTDDAFGGTGMAAGGRGSSGHNFTGAYQYHRNIQVACRLLFGEVDDSSGGSHDFNLFRLDLRVKTP